MFADTAAVGTEHADRMCLVEHQPSLIPPRQGAEGRQVGHVAVHAVMAFDHDQRPPGLTAVGGEEPLGGGNVVVRKVQAPGAGKLSALLDAVVAERVGQDEIRLAQQIANNGDVGGMTADEGDAILGAMKRRQPLLEGAMQRTLARNQPACRTRCTILSDRRLRRGDDARVAVESQIVV